jgi:hypothetical protein
VSYIFKILQKTLVPEYILLIFHFRIVIVLIPSLKPFGHIADNVKAGALIIFWGFKCNNNGQCFMAEVLELEAQKERFLD